MTDASRPNDDNDFSVLGEKEEPLRLLIRFMTNDTFTVGDVKAVSAVCERYARDKAQALEATGDPDTLKLSEYLKIDTAVLGEVPMESADFNPSA